MEAEIDLNLFSQRWPIV